MEECGFIRVHRSYLINIANITEVGITIKLRGVKEEIPIGRKYKEVTTKNINVIGSSISVASIVLVMVTVWQGIVIKRETDLKERIRMNEKIILLQKDYYDELLKQDEKMRRFRHDMHSHIVALQAYCKDEDIQKLQK